ncbi:hypothetical protein AALO_G00261100, partial [Alosa alosa]
MSSTFITCISHSVSYFPIVWLTQSSFMEFTQFTMPSYLPTCCLKHFCSQPKCTQAILARWEHTK